MPIVPTGGSAETGHAAAQRTWRRKAQLSSVAVYFDGALQRAGFDRAPWLTVFFAAGIGAWFLLPGPWQWCAAIIGGFLAALVAAFALQEREGFDVPILRRSFIAMSIAFTLGVMIIWLRSEMVGQAALDRPSVEMVQGYVLEREDQPAQARVRLIMAVRDADLGLARKIRVNVPADQIDNRMNEGAVLRMRARLMPPAPPMLPGSYNFARAAWFDGLSATGSLLGGIDVVEPAYRTGSIPSLQRSLSSHVRAQLDGSPGTIAAAFASGDRGGIAEGDEDAMRDSGLTHLLSISGLHVSAVIAAGYFLAMKLLALWPALALRIRLPIAAAAVGALAGIGYTLLTGAEVPTVRSCVGALLVLGALVLGREALTMRMVAVAGFVVLLLWPEALVGPSFQMSFAAVLAIVALHNCAPVRAFLGPREESRLAWLARRGAMLLLTGFVIEIALMPIVLFHFHRAGVYGAFANVVAIPLVTFISMPLIALALCLDVVGLGAPIWWLAGKSLDLLLAIAHWTASQPGAVKLMPQMGYATFALFMIGGLWLALWQGRARLWGFLPAILATAMLLATPVPDLLISGDGRHIGIPTSDNRLLSLRQSRSSYTQDNLRELAGVASEPIVLADWPGAQCSREFCVLTITRGGRDWVLLMTRNDQRVPERALAAACDQSDIVIADRWLPASCRPRWLKADRKLLNQTGGLSINLTRGDIGTVAQGQGTHGWWRAPVYDSARR